MLLVIAGLCVLLATSKVSPIAAFVLALLMMAIIAHVAGNAIGTRLRNHGDRQRSKRNATRTTPRAGDFAPATQLRWRTSLGKSMFVITGVGALVGAIVGGIALKHVYGNKLTIASHALSTGAFGVLGGFVGFLSGSFLAVLAKAIIHAQMEVPKYPNTPDPNSRIHHDD